MARFDDLCADFQKRKPRGPITAEVPWFNVPLELQKGSESVNDVLRKYLKDFNLEYLNEMGTVWFLYHDLWKCCTHEIKDGKIHFYRRSSGRANRRSGAHSLDVPRGRTA